MTKEEKELIKAQMIEMAQEAYGDSFEVTPEINDILDKKLKALQEEGDRQRKKMYLEELNKINEEAPEDKKISKESTEAVVEDLIFINELRTALDFFDNAD